MKRQLLREKIGISSNIFKKRGRAVFHCNEERWEGGWWEEGFSEREAAEWDGWGFDYEEAVRWHREGFTPKKASEWEDWNFQPEEAKIWVKVGVNNPEEAYLLTDYDIMPQEYVKWRKAGVKDVEDIISWVILNVTPQKVAKYLKRGYSPEDLADIELKKRDKGMGRRKSSGFFYGGDWW
jgi:hypothetical protein